MLTFCLISLTWNRKIHCWHSIEIMFGSVWLLGLSWLNMVFPSVFIQFSWFNLQIIYCWSIIRKCLQVFSIVYWSKNEKDYITARFFTCGTVSCSIFVWFVLYNFKWKDILLAHHWNHVGLCLALLVESKYKIYI